MEVSDGSFVQKSDRLLNVFEEIEKKYALGDIWALNSWKEHRNKYTKRQLLGQGKMRVYAVRNTCTVIIDK